MKLPVDFNRGWKCIIYTGLSNLWSWGPFGSISCSQMFLWGGIRGISKERRRLYGESLQSLKIYFLIFRGGGKPSAFLWFFSLTIGLEELSSLLSLLVPQPPPSCNSFPQRERQAPVTDQSLRWSLDYVLWAGGPTTPFTSCTHERSLLPNSCITGQGPLDPVHPPCRA